MWISYTFGMKNLKQLAPGKRDASQLGRIGEVIARKEYEKRGFFILAENFYNQRGTRMGEIDFIAVRDAEIRFVEVKTRSNGNLESALGSVDAHKQSKMLRAIHYFLTRYPKFQKYQPHIDIVAVLVASVDKRAITVKIYSDGIGLIC